MAIQSFGNSDVEDYFLTGRIAKRVRWRLVAKIVRRKLDMLHYAALLEDLRSPPGNRLEPLRGNWLGFYSVRVNDQWRVVFKWSDYGPVEVDVVDYHS